MFAEKKEGERKRKPKKKKTHSSSNNHNYMPQVIDDTYYWHSLTQINIYDDNITFLLLLLLVWLKIFAFAKHHECTGLLKKNLKCFNFDRSTSLSMLQNVLQITYSHSSYVFVCIFSLSFFFFAFLIRISAHGAIRCLMYMEMYGDRIGFTFYVLRWQENALISMRLCAKLSLPNSREFWNATNM